MGPKVNDTRASTSHAGDHTGRSASAESSAPQPRRPSIGPVGRLPSVANMSLGSARSSLQLHSGRMSGHSAGLSGMVPLMPVVPKHYSDYGIELPHTTTASRQSAMVPAHLRYPHGHAHSSAGVGGRGVAPPPPVMPVLSGRTSLLLSRLSLDDTTRTTAGPTTFSLSAAYRAPTSDESFPREFNEWSPSTKAQYVDTVVTERGSRESIAAEERADAVVLRGHFDRDLVVLMNTILDLRSRRRWEGESEAAVKLEEQKRRALESQWARVWEQIRLKYRSSLISIDTVDEDVTPHARSTSRHSDSHIHTHAESAPLPAAPLSPPVASRRLSRVLHTDSSDLIVTSALSTPHLDSPARGHVHVELPDRSLQSAAPGRWAPLEDLLSARTHHMRDRHVDTFEDIAELEFITRYRVADEEEHARRQVEQAVNGAILSVGLPTHGGLFGHHQWRADAASQSTSIAAEKLIDAYTAPDSIFTKQRNERWLIETDEINQREKIMSWFAVGVKNGGLLPYDVFYENGQWVIRPKVVPTTTTTRRKQQRDVLIDLRVVEEAEAHHREKLLRLRKSDLSTWALQERGERRIAARKQGPGATKRTRLIADEVRGRQLVVDSQAASAHVVGHAISRLLVDALKDADRRENEERKAIALEAYEAHRSLLQHGQQATRNAAVKAAQITELRHAESKARQELVASTQHVYAELTRYHERLRRLWLLEHSKRVALRVEEQSTRFEISSHELQHRCTHQRHTTAMEQQRRRNVIAGDRRGIVAYLQARAQLSRDENKERRRWAVLCARGSIEATEGAARRQFVQAYLHTVGEMAAARTTGLLIAEVRRAEAIARLQLKENGVLVHGALATMHDRIRRLWLPEDHKRESLRVNERHARIGIFLLELQNRCTHQRNTTAMEQQRRRNCHRRGQKSYRGLPASSRTTIAR
jgi:hypothetical protein